MKATADAGKAQARWNTLSGTGDADWGRFTRFFFEKHTVAGNPN